MSMATKPNKPAIRKTDAKKPFSLQAVSHLTVFNQSPIPTAIIDGNGTIHDMNRAMVNIIGHCKEEILRTPTASFWADKLIPPGENMSEKIHAIRDEIEKTSSSRLSLTIHKENGQNLTLDVTIFRVRIPGMIEENCFYVIHVADTTESQTTENTLKEIEGRYHAMFYRTLDIVFIINFSGKFIDANPQALRLFGIKRKDISNLDFMDFLSPEHQAWARSSIDNIVKNGYQRELSDYAIRQKDGSVIHIQSNGILIYRQDKPFAIFCVARDITNQKKNEEIRKTYIANLDFLAKSATELVQISSDDNIYEFIAHRLKSIIGAGVIAISAFDEVSDLLETKVIDGIETYMESITRLWRRNPIGMTYRIDAAAKNLLMTGSPIPSANLYKLLMKTVPIGICRTLEMIFGIQTIFSVGLTCKGRLYGVATIITFTTTKKIDTELIETFCSQVSVALQRWQAEKELKISEEKYHALTENINDILYSMNVEGIITHMGAQIRRYGFNPESIIGKPFIDFIHNEDRDKTRNNYLKMIATGEEHPAQCRLIDSDGRIHWFEDNGMIQRDDEGKIIGYTGIMRDITLRIEIEEALRISEAKLRDQKEVLEHKTAALTELIAQIEIEKNRIKDDVISNVEKIMIPLLDKLKLQQNPDEYIELLRHMLANLTSSFGRKLTAANARLTPRETEICTMIESGLHTKEIASLMKVTCHTVENHRKSIRKKLKIRNKSINLATHLKNS